MKYSTKTLSVFVLLVAFLASGCATVADDDFLRQLDKSAMQDRHEEFEQQLLPIHERTEIYRLEVEELYEAEH